MKLNKEDIKKYIAHRDPMLLLDRVIDYNIQTQEIHAQFDVKEDWEIFKGHFPNAPIMPGVLITEACAQASAVLVNLTANKTSEETLFYFMAIEKVRFRNPVVPNCVLDLKVKLTKKKASVVKFDAQAFVNGVLTTECSFTSKVLDR
jgi:3-hydroxyacyl-[acyl-carrier-protein] dehydratase